MPYGSGLLMSKVAVKWVDQNEVNGWERNCPRMDECFKATSYWSLVQEGEWRFFEWVLCFKGTEPTKLDVMGRFMKPTPMGELERSWRTGSLGSAAGLAKHNDMTTKRSWGCRLAGISHFSLCALGTEQHSSLKRLESIFWSLSIRSEVLFLRYRPQTAYCAPMQWKISDIWRHMVVDWSTWPQHLSMNSSLTQIRSKLVLLIKTCFVSFFFFFLANNWEQTHSCGNKCHKNIPGAKNAE